MENTAIEKNSYPSFEKSKVKPEIELSLEESGATVETIRRRQKIGHIASITLLYIIIGFLALLRIFPFYWRIITSLKSNSEVIASKQTFYPTIIRWSNYVYALDKFDFSKYLLNTLVVAVFSTLGTLITTILGAFAFARLNFKGRDAVFRVFLRTRMIPGEMMVISNYITVASFGWTGTGQTRLDAYLARIVPFWISVFYIYLLRQNFKQIPNELYLSAKVDGKSDWSFLWKVRVPLALPTIISITILKFMGTWNSYVWPNLVTSKSDFRLISNGLRGSAFTDVDTGRTSYGYQMAATVFVTVPLFLLFVVFRKYIRRGVGRAGIKG